MSSNLDETQQATTPERQQRIQGVFISSDSDNLVLTPCPKRVQYMCRQISENLTSNRLSPEEARKMAGKCNFLTGRKAVREGRLRPAEGVIRASQLEHLPAG